MCIRDNLGEPLLYPTFKPHTHKPYILIHCTNIVNVNGLLYIWQNPSAFNSDYVVAVFTEKITDQYQQIWLTEIKSNDKLETYVFLKNEFIKENYIDILDFKF